jgi:hypothetical protein
MDRRHVKILILACLGLLPAGLGNVRSQEPGGPGPGPRPAKPLGPIGMPHGENLSGGRFGPEPEGYRRLDQVPPEERQTFEHNLQMWRDLPPEERVALRNLARTRARAEIDKAVQDSGLHLDQDQREMFALRYTQERRKLERDLQRQAAAERAHRMPEILAKLKSEFGEASPGPKTEASPAAAAKPEASAAPASPTASVAR